MVTIGRRRVVGTSIATAMLLSMAAHAEADLGIDVFDQPDPVTLGNDVTYTVTVRNYGPDGRDAYVEARMPFEPSTITVPEIACMQPVRECGGYFVYSCFTRVACAVGWLDRGASRALAIRVHPTEASSYERSFFETDHYYDPDSSNNKVEEVTVVRDPNAPAEEHGSTGSWGGGLALLAAAALARRRGVGSARHLRPWTKYVLTIAGHWCGEYKSPRCDMRHEAARERGFVAIKGGSMRHARLVSAVVAACLAPGCMTITQRIDPEVQVPATPSVVKSPLHAGVYYSRQTAQQSHKRITGSSIFIARMGPATVRLFDELLPCVFEKTTRLASLADAEIQSKGVDVVVVPSLEHFDFRLGLDRSSERYSVSYRTTVYSRQGLPVASWVISGNAQQHALMTGVEGWIEDDAADAAAKFLEGFQRNLGPALALVGGRPTDPPPSFDPADVAVEAQTTWIPAVSTDARVRLDQAGVIAVRVTAASATERPLVMRGSDMRLRLRDGEIVEPSSMSAVLAMLDKVSHADNAAAAFIGAPLVLLASISNRQSSQKTRSAEHAAGSSTLFADRVLSKGKAESGIVLFRLPDGIQAIDGAKVTAWSVDPTAAEGAQIEAALSRAQ